jgi:hypothetical protein
MHNATRKFFALHRHLALPGIGNFTITTSPAQIDFVNRKIDPPPTCITFSNDGFAPDKQFYNFLSRELSISDFEAEHQFTAFASSLKAQLNEVKTIHLNGIGQLTKQSSHVLSFRPEENANDYFPVLVAERVIRKNATHVVKVGEHEKTSTEMHTALHPEKKKIQTETRRERWWIPAAILAFIGIVALIAYYVVHPV